MQEAVGFDGKDKSFGIGARRPLGEGDRALVMGAALPHRGEGSEVVGSHQRARSPLQQVRVERFGEGPLEGPAEG